MNAVDKAMYYEGIPEEERGLTAQKVIIWYSIMNRKYNERSTNNAEKPKP